MNAKKKNAGYQWQAHSFSAQNRTEDIYVYDEVPFFAFSASHI